MGTYGYFHRDGQLHVALADVTGHDMEAAIPVVLFSGILDNQMETPKPLEELCISLNRHCAGCSRSAPSSASA